MKAGAGIKSFVIPDFICQFSSIFAKDQDIIDKIKETPINIVLAIELLII